MDTFFARNRLSAYLDGDLPSSEAREVEAALHRDPELRAEFEAMRAGVELLRAHGPIAAPEGFASRLQVRLAAEPAPTRWRGVLRRVRPEYAGIAAIAALALVYVGTDHPAAPVVEPSVAVAQAPVLPTEPAAPVASPSTEGGAAPAGADGVLGNESGFATPSHPKPASPARPKSTQPVGEREVFQAAWEREDGAAASTPPDAAVAPATTPSTLYSPAPWRYRVHASGDNPLKQLIAVASALGGRIVDAKGRSIADYPMDEGDSRSVRVFVPSYNVEALQRKLGDLGSVETIATDPEMLYQTGAEVPVAIEVQR
jgi:negative regulator of sigma E activity